MDESGETQAMRIWASAWSLAPRGCAGRVAAKLSIDVAVNPIGQWVRTGDGGFTAGKPFAKSWIER